MRKFNPEKELYKIQHGNKNKIILFIISLLIVGIIGYSFALYQVRYSKRIIYTKVAPFSSKDLDLAVYVNGKKQSEVPKKDSGYKFLDMLCDVPYEGLVTYDDTKSILILPPMSIPNKCDVYLISDEYDETFEYTGDIQEYTVAKDGIYRIELWGASGGASVVSGGLQNNNGLGSYTKGDIYLTAGTTLYFYIGEAGENAKKGEDVLGGYNGGGIGTWDGTDDEASGGGGGATDVRLKKGATWDEFDSLKSRIMVAAGAGGASYTYTSNGGGLMSDETGNTAIPRATQTTGYAFGKGKDGDGNGTDAAGSFGVGGGGGGYFGGDSKNAQSNYFGFGGSSFISGHDGCIAITEDSTNEKISFKENSEHYSNYVFTNTRMIDGAGYNWTTERGNYVGMPTFDGTSTMNGNNGNGYAKITYLNEDRREFDFTGEVQEFIVPKDGLYKIELWGASGSTDPSLAGKGAYTSGKIDLKKDQKLYFYVGQSSDSNSTTFNGGGSCGGACTAGGGATDVRISNGNWNDSTSLSSRIMVAAGGGGYNRWAPGYKGGNAGGLTGANGAGDSQPTGGTQTAGGRSYSNKDNQNGKFGLGGAGGNYGGGGGSGYYGGGGGDNSDTGNGGAGGSSYISGYQGSVAITSETDPTPKEGCETGTENIECSYHYSNMIFTYTIMQSGNDEMPTRDGTSVMTGNLGNGFARITYLGS